MVPAEEETLRIKTFLAVRRNQTCDYLDHRRLRRRWSDWSAVTEVLGDVAARMVIS